MDIEKCQRCESKRLARVTAKCSDLCHWMWWQDEREHNGYVPDGVGVGGGDYLEILYCAECGQIQGDFPISAEAVDAVFER